MEQISQNELEAIRKTQERIEILKKDLQIAELTANNVILQVYCNYGLKPGIDNIKADGEIERQQQSLPIDG